MVRKVYNTFLYHCENRLKSIAEGDFLDRMADQEAERVIELYRQISEDKPSEGGERVKISGKSYIYR